MSHFLSRFQMQLVPRLAATMLALGGTAALAQELEIQGYGDTQSVTVSLPAGSRACLGPAQGKVFLRGTGKSAAPMSYFMRRSESGASGTFNRISGSGVESSPTYDFTIEIENRPDLLPGFFKICAANKNGTAQEVTLTLRGE